jgi:thiosulfate oxidation carrier complex protein SoxZ
MSDVGKVRLRVPSSIKAGDVVRARALVIHPMERVERDHQGRIVARTYNYVTRVVVTYLGKTIATFETTQSVSENPLIAFAFKATNPGPLTVAFTDTTGRTYEGRADIRFS